MVIAVPSVHAAEFARRQMALVCAAFRLREWINPLRLNCSTTSLLYSFLETETKKQPLKQLWGAAVRLPRDHQQLLRANDLVSPWIVLFLPLLLLLLPIGHINPIINTILTKIHQHLVVTTIHLALNLRLYPSVLIIPCLLIPRMLLLVWLLLPLSLRLRPKN